MSLAEPTAPVAGHLRRWVQEDPDRVVLRAGLSGETVTAGDLVSWSTAVAHDLLNRGVRPGDRVVSTLGNTVEHFALALATWAVGGCFVPLNPQAPDPERAELVALASPSLVVADRQAIGVARGRVADPVPDVVADPGLALASGGSTGRPKLVLSPGPFGVLPMDFLARTGFVSGQRQLVTGPVHHNGPFVMSVYGLLMDHEVTVMERFDAGNALDLIERHRIQAVFLVPTTMQRLLREQRARPRDLTSLDAVLHSAAPCPEWLKRAWIDLVGPEHLYEGYGASEGVGGALIRGDEWLEHPGSVGRPYCEIRIQADDGSPLPTGAVGEVFLRRHQDGAPTFHYIGAAGVRRADDGFVSVGDLGWLSDEGYLFLADRRDDLIISGGVNIYPVEVEAALSEHPGVADVAVIGRPDDEWGTRVHAVVEPLVPSAPPTIEELRDHCRARLAPYKVPKSFELTERLPRTAAGKLRRNALLQSP